MTSDKEQKEILERFVNSLDVKELRLWNAIVSAVFGSQMQARYLIEKLSEAEIDLLLSVCDDQFNEGHGCGVNVASR